MTAILITGDGLRHRYVANYLASKMFLVGIVSETKPRLPAGSSTEEDDVIRSHFRERDEKEDHYLGKGNEHFAAPEQDILEVPEGGSNSRETVEWIAKRHSRYVLLYGCSIIRDPLLSQYEGRMIKV